MTVTADWYPGALRNPAPEKYWGNYTGGPFKGVLHTTETHTFRPHATLYGGWHTSYPHFTVLHVKLKDHEEVWIYQHIPLSRAARALVNKAGGVQTNNDSAIQIEIVWQAGNAQNMPKILLDALGELMRWIESKTGIHRSAYDSFHFYPPEDGKSLGHEPWRMPFATWERFNGWCGHQHVPENSHGDPGKLDINYLLTVGVPSPILEEDLMLYSEIVTIPAPDATAKNRQLATLKGRVLLADKVSGVQLRAQDGGHFTQALVQKTEYAGILVLSFKGLNGLPAGTGNVWVDVEHRP